MVVRSTSFQRAVKGMKPVERRKLDKLFTKVSSFGEPWHFVAPNIQRKEHFLKAPLMRSLLKKLMELLSISDDIEDGYVEFCRKYELRGGQVKNHNLAPVLGMLKERQTFCNYLHRTNSLFRKLGDAEEFVRRLVQNERLSTNDKAVPLGLFKMWCTWTDPNDSRTLNPDDPFSFAKTGLSDELRANIGLPPNPHDRLLVFRYNRIEAGDLFKPTVLDAELHPYFEPSLVGEIRFGLTRPWPEAHLDDKFKAWGVELKRRPEGLFNKPLTVGQLKIRPEKI